MAPLTPEQETWLKQSLFTPVQIAKIKLGTADAQTVAAANRVIANKGSFLGGGTSLQQNNIGGGVTLSPSARYPALNPPNIWQNVPGDLMSNPAYKGPPVPYKGSGYTGGNSSNYGLSAGQNRTAARSPSPIPTPQWPTSGNSSNYGQGAGQGRYDPTSDQRTLPDILPPPVLGDPGEFPGAPSYPDINIPELVIRDFLPQAKEQYAAAYAPLYQALEMGKTNATGSQQRSDQVIKGLYEGLAQDFNTQGTAQAQQYKDSGAQSQAVAQALQDKIGDIYGGSNQQEANFAASLGQQAAGAEAIQGNAGERQFQQAEAATSGANQQNFYDQGASAAQNYGSQMSGAANTEGASRRSDLVAQLNNVLSQYDQQALGYKSQEAQGAIQQSNVLSERDLSAQRDRINTILQEAGITDARIAQQSAAAIQAYEAKYGVMKDQYQAQRDTYTDAVAQRQAQMAAIAAQQKAAADAAQQAIENQQTDTGLLIDATSKGLSIDPKTGQVIPLPGGAKTGIIPESPTGKFSDLPVGSQIVKMAEGLDPSRPGTDYEDFYYEFMRTHDPKNFNAQNFADQFGQAAAAAGLNGQAAKQLAPDLWIRIQQGG